jgi:hypothetical protein
MACQKAVCQECATVWDGINHCTPCLARARQGLRPGGSWLGYLAVITSSAGLFWLTSRLIVWSSVHARGLF